jgi:ribonuclease BN (tRNA processing enzyme)
MAIPQDADPAARRLHATPETIGTIAESVGAKTLLLSHFMARSLRTLDRNVGIIRSLYAGRIVVAEDLACVSLLP